MTAYLRNVWRLRYFWMALVRSDLRKRYRRSVIGVGWSLLHPIAMTVVLCTAFGQLFNTDFRTYAPMLLSGLVTWNFICAVMKEGCQSFLQGESYIRQYPAPLAIYPLRTVLGAAVHFLMGLAVVLVFAWAVNGFGNLPAVLSLPLSVLLLFVFGWSLAVLAGTINVMFQDTQHLTEVLLQILFYLTPIIYSAEFLRERRMAWFLQLNPLASYLDLVRVPILQGRLPGTEAYAIAAGTAVLTLGMAAWVLSRIERRIIFYF